MSKFKNIKYKTLVKSLNKRKNKNIYIIFAQDLVI